MGLLDGAVALVVGGARPTGMGAAEARRFAAEGAQVVIADVLDDLGERTAADIDGCSYAHLDVTSERDWTTVVEDVVGRAGRLDVMVNNAGMYTGRRIVNVSLDEWERMVAVNQTGTFLSLKVAGAAMVACGNGGSMVLVSSTAGLVGKYGGASYTASKWAVRGISRVAAKELGPHGIRVNSLYPGFIQTEMFDQATKNMERDDILSSIPLGRVGEPDDIAKVALFLASDLASYCTGQEFVVDGGNHG